jgi:hypothetical protein
VADDGGLEVVGWTTAPEGLVAVVAETEVGEGRRRSWGCSVATTSGCLLLLMVLQLRRHGDLFVYLFFYLCLSLTLLPCVITSHNHSQHLV